MSANNGSLEAASGGDVALLVDWENLKFSLEQRERQPNVTALREVAERFGRVVYARAYADWQNPVHKDDPARLYLAGLEPVYVLTRRYHDSAGEAFIKNSVDVKLAADCIEASHRFPNIGTYIIVSGDHGFLHIVNTLRPHGKRVVVIGVSWTTSAQLTDQADVVLYYDLDVEPPPRAEGEAAPRPAELPAQNVPPRIAQAADLAAGLLQRQSATQDVDTRRIAETLQLVLAIVKEHREARREFSVSLLGQELQKRMNAADFQRVAKGRALPFAQALNASGLIKLVQRDFVDWIFLPDEPDDLISAAAPAHYDSPRYDYAGFVFADLSPQEQDAVLRVINDERQKPGINFLTFKRIMDCASEVLPGRDPVALKNLVNNMLVVSVLRFDEDKTGRDPETGHVYSFRTITLDYQNPDVRRALRLG